MTTLLNQTELARALALPDLTDNQIAPDHALQKLIRLTHRALQQLWPTQLQTLRTSPMVPVESNYDRLNYPTDGAARDARYTRYVTERYILRTQTSAAIPDTLAGLHGQSPADLTLMLPGMVYRRDCIDKLHCAEPHQLDIWRVVDHKHRRSMTHDDLLAMIDTVLAALVPTTEWRTIASPHPYTVGGVQIDVRWQGQWVEVGECGQVHPAMLSAAQLNHHSGLAMGLGLDRLLMLRKNMPDIRLLRSGDIRIQEQMNDLSPYRPVSNLPSMTRDLSLVVDCRSDLETMGDKLRLQTQDASIIESVELRQQTAYEDLSQTVREKLGMARGQKNVLLRLVLRDLSVTLTADKANQIRNDVYRVLHQGTVQEFAQNAQ